MNKQVIVLMTLAQFLMVPCYAQNSITQFFQNLCTPKLKAQLQAIIDCTKLIDTAGSTLTGDCKTFSQNLTAYNTSMADTDATHPGYFSKIVALNYDSGTTLNDSNKIFLRKELLFLSNSAENLFTTPSTAISLTISAGEDPSDTGIIDTGSDEYTLLNDPTYSISDYISDGNDFTFAPITTQAVREDAQLSLSFLGTVQDQNPDLYSSCDFKPKISFPQSLEEVFFSKAHAQVPTPTPEIIHNLEEVIVTNKKTFGGFLVNAAVSGEFGSNGFTNAFLSGTLKSVIQMIPSGMGLYIGGVNSGSSTSPSDSINNSYEVVMGFQAAKSISSGSTPSLSVSVGGQFLGSLGSRCSIGDYNGYATEVGANLSVAGFNGSIGITRSPGSNFVGALSGGSYTYPVIYTPIPSWSLGGITSTLNMLGSISKSVKNWVNGMFSSLWSSQNNSSYASTDPQLLTNLWAISSSLLKTPGASGGLTIASFMSNSGRFGGRCFSVGVNVSKNIIPVTGPSSPITGGIGVQTSFLRLKPYDSLTLLARTLAANPVSAVVEQGLNALDDFFDMSSLKTNNAQQVYAFYGNTTKSALLAMQCTLEGIRAQTIPGVTTSGPISPMCVNGTGYKGKTGGGSIQWDFSTAPTW